ncbi:fibulin-2-like [Pieris brassicae]|uniref:fibulin-2-like n=1 Tax=Pieris brassicae TaxID=7116 RepID=UPI001E65E668|nr:fibulin-2-like [Pieris brassicae]
MWKYTVLFSVFICSYGVKASLSDQLTETTQLCCNQGTTYARNHTSDDCSSSIPPDVPSAFGTLCIFAMDQCCKEYFQKKRDCESGIESAISTNTCGSTPDSSKKCCVQCVRGSSVGKSRGIAACNAVVDGKSAVELLATDVYTECCKKAAEKASGTKPTRPASVSIFKKDEEVYSVCEEYAPNELCAHHCIPIPGSYKCECNPGFMLMADGRNCKEVTKNRCKPHNPCQHKCNDNGVEVKCSCRRGYRLMDDGKSCEDIDECLLDTPVCLTNTQCHNILGSYKCIPVKHPKTQDKGQCPPGFARNLMNHACDDINECKLPSPPCPEYLCENTIGAYKCGGMSGDPLTPHKPTEDRCPPGFKMGANEECYDVDECATNKDDCNKMSQFCINTRGSFYCQDKVSKHCPPGFKTDPATNKCEDIDECEDGQDICRPDQICVNILGEYDCKPKNSKSVTSCPDGMRMNPSRQICEDIDECVEGTHLCDQYQNCLNTNGSHECRCKLGFELDHTTGACTDINECATDQNTCIPQSQRCDNTVGSYLCIRFISCGTGYILHHSSSTCEDIDECALGTHNCDRAGPEYHCVNIPGSFRCQRKPKSTTTTPEPEYEYVYYDSEEEIEDEKTNSTTTTQQPVTTQVIPKSTEPEPEPKPAVPEVKPNLTEPQPIEPEVKPDNTKQNEIKPEGRPIDTGINPTEATDRDIYHVDENELEPRPDIENLPETEATSPKVVDIVVGEETAIVKGEKKEDGSVVVNTQDIPKNEWTKINETPSNCQPGFESDGNGACYDIDECTSNRHTCSGLTESCRNTMGGYLCDCAVGFRRDFGSGACIYYEVPSSTNKPLIHPLPFTIPTMTSTVTTTPLPIPTSPPTTPTIRTYPTTPSTIPIPESTTPITTPTIPSTIASTLPTTQSTTTSTTQPPTTPTSTLPPPTASTRRYFWGYPDYRKTNRRPFKAMTTCDTGYHFNSQSGQCEDIDECTNGKANCASVEICINTLGGYRCECPPNWKLDPDRQRCVPLTTSNRFPSGYGNRVRPVYPDPQEIIPQTKGGGRVAEPEVTPLGHGNVFKCPWGTQLADDNTCQDIDECSTGDAKCGPLQLCTNLPGGYTCSCPQGHKLIGDHECADVDECDLGGSSPICSQNADCLNTIGSYRCQCHEGFKAAPINDKVCVDVDECMEAPSGSLCSQRCNNVWGGYRCSCHRGYRLNPDNRTCSDVDECTEFKSKHLCVGKCVNEPGSYRCFCPSGYRLSEDKRSCIDIDECETGIAPCASGGQYEGASDVCLNTRGGYRCHRISCPTGYRLESRHRCTKIQTYCPPSDWECAHQPSTYSYNFITFVSKLYIPETQVDLFTMRGPNWAYAKMRFQLRLVDVNAPPSVSQKADINSFLLTQTGNQAVMSLVRSLEGPQSIELELSMELYSRGQFGGIAVAKLYIYVSEHEF